MATAMNTQLSEHLPMSPGVEPKSEKKAEPRPSSLRDVRPRTERGAPGISNLTPIHRETPRTRSSSTCRFGSLSHHSFFSRHHPHPQHVGHIQDLAGNRVCTVRAEFSPAHLPHSSLLGCCVKMPRISFPIGDPQSNREPLLLSEAWKKELKQLSSRLAAFATESEPRDKKEKEPEKPPREHGAKYSAQTGRLIPAPTRATSHFHSDKSTRSRYGGTRAFLLEDRDLLIFRPTKDANPADCLPVVSSGSLLGDSLPWATTESKAHVSEFQVLELLCQILQTDSLRSIQAWLLGSSQKEKDLAFNFLNMALKQLWTQTPASISEEQLLSQFQVVQDKEKDLSPSYRQSQKKNWTLQGEKVEHLGKAQALGMHLHHRTEENVQSES